MKNNRFLFLSIFVLGLLVLCASVGALLFRQPGSVGDAAPTANEWPNTYLEEAITKSPQTGSVTTPLVTPSGGDVTTAPENPTGGDATTAPENPSGGDATTAPENPSGGNTTTTAVTPSGGKTTTAVTPSGGKTTTAVTPSGGKTTTAVTPSGGNTTTTAVTPSGGKTTTAVTPSGGKTTTAVTPSGGKTTTAVTPSGGNTTTAVTPSGGNTTTAPVTSSAPTEGEMLEPTLKPAQITLLRPVASNVLTASNNSVLIDYSNTKDGYIMVRYLTESTVRLKVQITGTTTTYTYNLTPLEWTVFPLTDGNGDYQVKVFKNVVDNRYSTVISLNFSVALSDEFAPFLRPNQYVNYENADQTMKKAQEIVTGKTNTLDKVKAIYSYIVANISYDYEKAASLPSTYLPDLDLVLAQKKGICFDYAALMAGMLRSQNIPCKLVVGYAGTEYHAWISVWTPEQGWINGVVFFDGSSWNQMDPTFAASGVENKIASTNYTTKYIY